MPGIKGIRLTDATFLVGPQLQLLGGHGEDMFSLTPAVDTGRAVSGALGDVMFVRGVNRLWTAEFTFLQASDSIDLLLELDATLGVFGCKCDFGDFNFVGVMQIRNQGPLVASKSADTRVITADAAYISGNVNAAPGFPIQIT